MRGPWVLKRLTTAGQSEAEPFYGYWCKGKLAGKDYTKPGHAGKRANTIQTCILSSAAREGQRRVGEAGIDCSRRGRQAHVPLHPLQTVPIVPREDGPRPQPVTVEPQTDPNIHVLLEPHLGVLGPVLSNTVS